MQASVKLIKPPIESLSPEDVPKVIAIIQSFAESYPKSLAPRRMCLEIAQGAEFRRLVRDYLVNGLERGIPSLFVDVKGLYVDQQRMAVIGEVVEELIQALEKDSGLHDDGTSCMFVGRYC